MLVRFSNVIYWAACGLSGLIVLLSIFGVLIGHGNDRWVAIATFLPSAVIIWTIGRAFRYVLAGR